MITYQTLFWLSLHTKTFRHSIDTKKKNDYLGSVGYLESNLSLIKVMVFGGQRIILKVEV